MYFKQSKGIFKEFNVKKKTTVTKLLYIFFKNNRLYLDKKFLAMRCNQTNALVNVLCLERKKKL